MIRHSALPTTSLPDPLTLDAHARTFMFAWLSGVMRHKGELSAADWCEAYGVAADEQTARVARRVLAAGVRGVAA